MSEQHVTAIALVVDVEWKMFEPAPGLGFLQARFDFEGRPFEFSEPLYDGRSADDVRSTLLERVAGVVLYVPPFAEEVP